jgi:serine/threonine-protein kinase RsbW
MGLIESPNVRLALLSRPENVVVVRDVVAGLADALELGVIAEDVKAAVSEAANNTVIHAYGGHEGPLEVEFTIISAALEVVVRDRGIGIGPRAVDDSHPGRGIGLMVIEALTDRCELRAPGDGRGLEVAMRFEVPLEPEVAGLSVGGAPQRAQIDHGDAVEVVVAPWRLSAPIFDRLVTGLAARAGFSIDRLSDVQLVVDALTARLKRAVVDDRIRLTARTRKRGIELRVSPLRAGGGTMLVSDSAIGDLGPVIGRLADEVATSLEADGEVLAIVLSDRRTPFAGAQRS